MICDRYLRWQVRRELFAFDTIVDWSSSSGHMMRDGAFRAAAFLQRVATGELVAHAELSTATEASNSLQRRAVQLAAIVFSVSVLMTVTEERVQLGVNLFTAEAFLMAAAAAMLLRTIRRLI
jgi:hypothetical protein